MSCRRAGRPSAPLAQAALRLLGACLRAFPSWNLSDSQVAFLLRFAFEDLERSDTRGCSFGLLRSFLGRRRLLPEIYTLMETVAELLVRAQAAQVRQLCSQAFLQYLLDYPLAEKRLNGHLEFLVQNLEYKFAAGREAVLDTLGAVINRFPKEAVEAQAAFLFVPIAARLVNDTVPSCRTLAGSVLKLLLQRVGAGPADALLDFAEKWLAGGVPQLQRGAAQILGLASDCIGPRVERR